MEAGLTRTQAEGNREDMGSRERASNTVDDDDDNFSVYTAMSLRLCRSLTCEDTPEQVTCMRGQAIRGGREDTMDSDKSKPTIAGQNVRAEQGSVAETGNTSSLQLGSSGARPARSNEGGAPICTKGGGIPPAVGHRRVDKVRGSAGKPAAGCHTAGCASGCRKGGCFTATSAERGSWHVPGPSGSCATCNPAGETGQRRAQAGWGKERDSA
jgi:hypothetical protein